MYRIACASLLLASTLAAESIVLIVDAKRLNIRECGDAAKCAVIGKLHEGDVVFARSLTRDGWYELEDGFGYIHGAYVVNVKNAAGGDRLAWVQP